MKQQRGVALVTVMLVVSLVTVICTGLIVRQQLAIRASGNQLTGQQARQYALGGEALGMAVLARDFKAPGSDPQNPVDHPLEAWAKPLPAFPIEQGELIVRIEDLAGRFNLNSLLQAGKPNQLALERFRRLLVRLELSLTMPNVCWIGWMKTNSPLANTAPKITNTYWLSRRTARRAMRCKMPRSCAYCWV